MHPYDAGRWLLLALLWSVQYIFLRISVPVFGAMLVSEWRVLFSAAFLLPWVIVFARQPLGLRAHWRDHVAVGVTNNVVPFALFAWAAAILPAGYLAIISGTVPLWTALAAALFLKEPLGTRSLAGFALGVIGIALIVRLGPVALDTWTLLATLAATAGAAMWGWAGVVIKQSQARVPPVSLAAGSVLVATLMLSPTWAWTPPLAEWTWQAVAAAVAAGALCSGLAYLPFFTLVRDIGPTRTLTVGFAVPIFGVLWGWMILDEPVTIPMLAGTALVVAALGLVLRK
ncbi:MAG: DMT family transporter [Betaproteobacteria bacterium]